MLSPAIIYYTVVQLLHFHTQPLSHSLFRKYFTKPSDIYKRLGQFDYGQPSCTTDHINTCIKKDKDYFSWIYIGEVEEGTDHTPHGIGIKVDRNRSIEEGYWKDGELYRGRRIYGNEEYYVGEFKEGRWDGEGTFYKYGDKYTGQWDGYKGQGEINYKDGTKYKGQWESDYYWY